MKNTTSFELNMIAPCGINCHICYAHLRPNHPCPGCNQQDGNSPEHCRTCALKACALSKSLQFCSDCCQYPCNGIKRLDRRYRLKYQNSLIESARRLKELGCQLFLAEEQVKWTCKKCSGLINLHSRACSECGKAYDESLK